MKMANLYNWAWAQELKSTRKGVLLYLVKMSDKNLLCSPSLKDVSAATGLNIKTITSAIKELDGRGLIKAKRGCGNRGEYQLVVSQNKGALS